MRRVLCCLTAVLLVNAAARAVPAPDAMNSSEIRLALEKLNVLGRALYVAAHPDDENTGLISYWANGPLYDAAYLSMTRGDGGQNLIGPELRDQLGVIRTQELLAARRIDHGQQFFTRANDFGFSKRVDETLRIWDRDKILADTVWAIRKFRPDVIVTRFSPDDNETHGHHTASAQLAVEAFRAAADSKRFPEQLKYVEPWQATRILWNTSEFFFRARNVPFDPSGLIEIQAGGYQPLLGKSFPEISSASRTMHKSQGFGVSIERGARKEYFKLLDGKAANGNNLFSDVDTTWSRVPNGSGVADKVRVILAAYDATKPSASVPALLELRKTLHSLGENEWAEEKSGQVDQIIAACLGLHLDAISDKAEVQPGESLQLQVEAINRASVPVKLKSAQLLGATETINVALAPNELFAKKLTARLPGDLPLSQPYWLRTRGTEGTFTVADQTSIGLPENPPPFSVDVALEIAGEEIHYQLEPRFRKVDRVEGETTRPLVIAPPVFVQLPRPVFVFGSNEAKMLNVRVIASADHLKGAVALEAPSGWKVEPASVPVELFGAESEATCVFKLTPPNNAGEATLRAVTIAENGARTPAFNRERIEYPHIEPQTLISPAQAQVVRAQIENKASHVGYLPGAGDAIPESLREIGSEVKVIENVDVKAENLRQFDAIVLGVRAGNVNPARMAAWMPELMTYAKNGGVVIYQYNTTPGAKPEHLPFPLKISRDRVTDENAEMRILAPDHPVLNFPNKITADDFKGWVQERGLYFANEWDQAWKPILSSNDPGEKPLDGGLLVARAEKGWFIYTGLSFFRQLPAGVPGAYRIFANMISLG
ncbi:MAG: PIG-L family deacetylase, partial [Verrucomicrobiota bacterium]|nr:PIG-L family deacetylase [Verrucomicrobiota bacterium]